MLAETRSMVEADHEFRDPVAVNIPEHDGRVAMFRNPEFLSIARKGVGPDEIEGLIAVGARVRVDFLQIDEVNSTAEVRDPVGPRRG